MLLGIHDFSMKQANNEFKVEKSTQTLQLKVTFNYGIKIIIY